MYLIIHIPFANKKISFSQNTQLIYSFIFSYFRETDVICNSTRNVTMQFAVRVYDIYYYTLYIQIVIYRENISLGNNVQILRTSTEKEKSRGVLSSPVLFSKDDCTFWQDVQHKSPARNSNLDSSVNLLGILWNSEKKIKLTIIQTIVK